MKSRKLRIGKLSQYFVLRLPLTGYRNQKRRDAGSPRRHQCRMVKIRQNLHRSASSCPPSAVAPALPAQNQGEGERQPPLVSQPLPTYIPGTAKVLDHPPPLPDELPPQPTASTSIIGAIEDKKPPRNMDTPGRVTRSRLAPDWALPELFTLACEVAAVEEDCRRSLSVHQRWKIVAEHCAALGVRRSFAQCRRKWDSLSLDCRAIARWEGSRGPSEGSYWCMEVNRREELGLPREIDRDLFALVGGALALQEGPVPEEGDSDGGEADGADSNGEGLDVDVPLSQLGFSPKKARATGKDGNIEKDSLPEVAKLNKDGKHIVVSGPTEQLSKDRIEGLDVDFTLSQLARATGEGGNVDEDSSPRVKMPEMVNPQKDGNPSLDFNQMMDIDQRSKGGIEASSSKKKPDVVRHQKRKNCSRLPISDRMHNMVLQLQKNAELMETILQGEMPEGSNSCYLADLKYASTEAIGSTRLQADRLLVAVDGLCESIGQFCNIVKEEQPVGS